MTKRMGERERGKVSDREKWGHRERGEREQFKWVDFQINIYPKVFTPLGNSTNLQINST